MTGENRFFLLSIVLSLGLCLCYPHPGMAAADREDPRQGDSTDLDQLQAPAVSNSPVQDQASKTHESGLTWSDVWGMTPNSAIGVGMWSLHYFRENPYAPGTNWQQNFIGFNYKSFFIGTFSNTQFQQSVTAGIRRNLWEKQYGDWYMAAGYNVGAIWGYRNGNGFFISEWSPIIPMVQAFYTVNYKGFGISISSVPSVATIGFRFEF